MITLKNITAVAVNNNECVVLKVLEGHEMDLIALGCFDGNETMFRLTKGRGVICTVFANDKAPHSWEWGGGITTLVGHKTEEMGRKIQECIERGFGIKCQKR